MRKSTLKKTRRINQKCFCINSENKDNLMIKTTLLLKLSQKQDSQGHGIIRADVYESVRK